MDKGTPLMDDRDGDGGNEDNDKQRQRHLQDQQQLGPHRQRSRVAQAELGAAAEAQVDIVPDTQLPGFPTLVGSHARGEAEIEAYDCVIAAGIRSDAIRQIIGISWLPWFLQR